jgi:hypothetical protein
MIRAVLVGSIILAVAILGARVIAPYRITVVPNQEHPSFPFIYRLNAVTGSVTTCESHLNRDTNLFQMYCD